MAHYVHIIIVEWKSSQEGSCAWNFLYHNSRTLERVLTSARRVLTFARLTFRYIGHRGWDTGTRVKRIRLVNVFRERDSNNNGKTVTERPSFTSSLRSFFRRIRPVLAWQSEQIGRLNLSELQRGELLHRRDLHQPSNTRSRSATSNQINSFVSFGGRKSGRVALSIVALNEQTHARTHSVTRRCAHNRRDDWLSMYAANYWPLIARTRNS